MIAQMYFFSNRSLHTIKTLLNENPLRPNKKGGSYMTRL
jgi:hypothetical protein